MGAKLGYNVDEGCMSFSHSTNLTVLFDPSKFSVLVFLKESDLRIEIMISN